MCNAWKFGNDIDTDQIIAARHLVTTDAEELARHCLVDVHSRFATDKRPGDVVVAGENFGCGSSREHAPLALIGARVSAVIAKSFARIFFRNSVNVGLPLLQCPEAVEAIEEGDRLVIDAGQGKIVNETRGDTYTAQPMPEVAREIMEAGGLMHYVARKHGLTPRRGMEV